MPLLDKEFLASLHCKQLGFHSMCDFAGRIMLNPICFTNGPSALTNFACDAYSYLGLKNVLHNTMIGRYCSLASKLYIGAPKHKAVTNFNAELFNHQDFAWALSERTTKEDKANEENALPNKLEQDTNKTTNKTTINSQTLQSNTRSVVKIGHDVWIGEGVTILEGVNIGTGAVIGAGSMITKDVPPYAIVVGFDRQLKNRFSDEVISDLLASQWWEYDLPEMWRHGVAFNFENPRSILPLFRELAPDMFQQIAQNWVYFDIPDFELKDCSFAQVEKFFMEANK